MSKFNTSTVIHGITKSGDTCPSKSKVFIIEQVAKTIKVISTQSKKNLVRKTSPIIIKRIPQGPNPFPFTNGELGRLPPKI